MPGAALSESEFRQLEEKVLAIESGAILVISGSLPPGIRRESHTVDQSRATPVVFAALLIVQERRSPLPCQLVILNW